MNYPTNTDIRKFCNMNLYCVMNYPTNIYGSFGILPGDFMSCNSLTCKFVIHVLSRIYCVIDNPMTTR